MYFLTKEHIIGCKMLLKWVNGKPNYWSLIVIVGRNVPNHTGGIEKRALDKKDVIEMLRTILRSNGYDESDRLYLNRMRYLHKFDKIYGLTENDL